MNGALSTPDLLGLVNREITPDVIHRAALQLGESDEHIRSAVSTSVPSALTALSDVASSDSGAAHLTRMIRGIDANRAGTDSVSSLLGSTSGREQGTTLFDTETGTRGSKIAEAVARASGIKADSAHQLLGGATGAALLAIGRNAERLDPGGLQAMLGEQRGEFVRRLPAPVASLFDGARAGGPGAVEPARAVERPEVVERPEIVERSRVAGEPAIRRVAGGERRGWLAPLVLLGALFLIALPLMRALRRPVVRVVPIGGLPAETMRGATLPLSLPNGQRLTVRQGSPTQHLAAFMAGSQATPARFTLAPLNFEFGSTQLTPESMTTLDEVAAILRAYPTATIRVESYTDSVGTAASNLDLSRDRSETVKGLLGGKGIEPTRVATAGLGQENPVASNETEGGRALNRRTDIVVTGR
ncbi:MAG TPA: OmpA family protein [Polyangia bacterium]|nr:OmpA family protein [Polyangia bacterium]